MRPRSPSSPAPLSFRTALLALSTAATASAEPAIPALPATAIEEIVVTARKRIESIEDVPIAITALSGEALADHAITDLRDVARVVPNFFMTEGTIEDTVQIRGLGTPAGNQGFENTVALVIDGVYYGRNRYLRQGFFDLDRLEVLRGPQSVYFGRNATAGALSLNTRLPGPELESSLLLSRAFGTDHWTAEGAVSGPILDDLGARLAIHWSDFGGWMDNSFFGGEDPGRKEVFGRLSIVGTPFEDVELIARSTFARYEQAHFPTELNICSANLAAAIEASGSTEDCVPNNVRSGGQNVTGGFEKTPEGEDFESWSNALTANWNLGGAVVTSVTSYLTYGTEFGVDPDFWDVDFLFLGRPEDFQSFSQELHVSSSRPLSVDWLPGGQTFDWIAGAYYERSDFATLGTADLGLVELAPGMFLGGLGAPVPGSAYQSYDQSGDSWAVFGEVTWNVTDSLRFVPGGRFSVDSKEADVVGRLGSLGNPFDRNPVALAAFAATLNWTEMDFSDDRTTTNFSPTVTAQWDAFDGGMVYGSYKHGFKAGGFDLAIKTQSDPNEVPPTFEFEDETVVAYEVGGKATFVDPALQLNVALFRNDFDDLQVLNFDGVANFLVSNASAARTQGVEVDGRWHPLSRLALHGAFAWTDHEFTEYRDAPCYSGQTEEQGCTNERQDVSGRRLARAPNVQGSAGFLWQQPLPWFGLSARLGSDANYVGNLQFQTDHDPRTEHPGYWKYNALFSVSGRDDHWDLSVIGENLADESTFAFIQDVPLFAGSFWVMEDRPRTVALQGRLRF